MLQTKSGSYRPMAPFHNLPKRADMSSYLVDNLDAHLVLNWIDFDIADRLKNPRKQIISIDKLEIEQKKFYKASPDSAWYKCFAAISYTRKDPSVNGIGTLCLHLAG